MGKAKEAQRFVEIASQAFHDTHEQHQRLARSFDEAGGARNERARLCAQVDCGAGSGDKCNVDKHGGSCGEGTALITYMMH